MELQTIQNKIYAIRDQNVMLDFYLAEIYEVETKRLKEAVRRNLDRFPSDFMFELTDDEFESLRSQFASSKRGGRRYPLFVFSEQRIRKIWNKKNVNKSGLKNNQTGMHDLQGFEN